MEALEGTDEIVQEFLVESHENLDQLDRDLVELERDPESTELLSSVFRTIHTIKGTSGFLAFNTLESVTHVGESLLARLRDGEMALTPDVTTVLLEVVDAVRALLAQIERTGDEGEETYAALVGRLEAILTGGNPSPVEPGGLDSDPTVAAGATDAPEPPLLGELLVERGVVEQDDVEIALAEQGLGDTRPVGQILVEGGAQADEVADAVKAQSEARRSVADSTIRVDVGLLDSLMNLVGELVLTRNQMLQRVATREDVELARTTHRLNLIAGELQEGVMKTRMQQIDTVWSKLPRVVRDLSVQLGKSVDLRMEGRETELDKTILEAVRDPLTHLVRNSIDHGIEAREVRRSAGKAEQGTLTLRAFHEGGQVNLEITDDGAGIDPAKLRAKAVSRGMMPAEAAERLSDHEAINLVFAPGFSTATAVTNVSGRGVGMDVVKTNIEKIGGSIDLASVAGVGTTVRIRIPLTLAIIPALVVTSDGNRYAIPQVNLVELVRMDTEQARTAIETVQGAPVYRLRGRLLPLVDLREQLGLPSVERRTTYVVVLQAENQQYGVVVDDILDTEEIVVKPLGAQLRSIALFAGATIMGDGSVALILDATAIARKAGMSLDSALASDADDDAGEAEDRTSVLVVDLGDGRRAAIPLEAVDRLEEIAASLVERAGPHDVVQYRGEILPLVRLAQVLHGAGSGEEGAPLKVVVCRSEDGLVGVVVAGILDIVDADLSVRTSLDSTGQAGSAVIDGHVTELVDMDSAVAGVTGRRLARTA